MASSATQTLLKRTAQTTPVDATERRLRRTGAWLLLYLALQTELGLAWDRNWHDLIGRDQFWTLPHIMLYSGVGGAGLVALVIVATDTLRYLLKQPGVDDSSTISIFRYFHAPLGYILLGFGALTDLVAAPFDNYWHQLYGIDVTLWSPFHIMGTFGGILEGLGILYIFSSEIVIERQAERPARRLLGFTALEWGALIVLAAFMNLALPALTAFIPVVIGPAQIFTYALPLAMAGGFSLISAVQLTRKPGSATLTAGILFVESLYTQAFVPFALKTSVSVLGISYRSIDRRPEFNSALLLMPLLFLISALFIDWLTYRRRQRQKDALDMLPANWLLAIILAFPALLIPPLLVALIHLIPAYAPFPSNEFVLQPTALEMLLALPGALIVGALVAPCSKVFGDIWYMNRR